MNRLNKLDIFYHNRPVGTMALYQKRLAAFEYSRDWLADGFSISPFSLPLEKQVFVPQKTLSRVFFAYLQTVCRTDGDVCW